MKDFAISCYRSSVHRWWFSLNVVNKRDNLPRFKIPLLKLMRSEKRPFTRYAQILNDLSPTEWADLGLDDIPPPVSLPNVQLPGLVVLAAQSATPENILGVTQEMDIVVSDYTACSPSNMCSTKVSMCGNPTTTVGP